ncbi:ComEC/Rec2 family competence protein [Wukongibacter baidiensis]
MNSKNIKIITLLLAILFLVVSYSSAEAITINQPTTNEPVKSEDLKVHYINVGQADSIFIDYQDYDILIDGGNNSDGDLVVNYLKNIGVDDIEILIATHPHENNIGGLDNVLAAYKVENIIDSGSKSDTKTYEDYWNAVLAEESNYQEDSNITFNLGDNVEFKIIEMGDNYSNANDNSVVCMLDYGDTEFLFMGDLEENIEKANLDKFTDIDVLKLGLHGSKASTSKEFLDVVKPEYGIISCGLGNKYGHPHNETITKLDEYKIKSFRTDQLGNIIAKVDENGLSFEVGPPIIKIPEGNSNNVQSSSGQELNTDSGATQIKVPESKTKTVYVTETGKKYHTGGCGYLKKSKIPINLTDAKIQGYTPCSRCKP